MTPQRGYYARAKQRDTAGQESASAVMRQAQMRLATQRVAASVLVTAKYCMRLPRRRTLNTRSRTFTAFVLALDHSPIALAHVEDHPVSLAYISTVEGFRLTIDLLQNKAHQIQLL